MPKPKITPGQGLLLLIEYYQDDPIKQTSLKKLYLSGAKDTEYCIALCDALLEEPLLDEYELVIDEASINADPTRRYFETHLAFQTLNYQLPHINLGALYNLYRSSAALVDKQMPQEELDTINQVFKGECKRPAFKKRENYQYNFYIRRLKEKTVFPQFTKEAREKIKWLVRVQYMALVNGWQFTDMPLDIYKTEQFSNRTRGKIRLGEEIRSIRNRSFGLLKGHMPLAADDLALSDWVFEHMKSADYSCYDIDSPVIQACFQQLVHPFSNSISGCFLVHLRTLACLHTRNASHGFTASLPAFTQLMRLSMASTLFYSGGHSLYEYAAVLASPEIQEFFAYMPGFAHLDLDHLFYHGNEMAFDTALVATLKYNASLLTKRRMHLELLSSNIPFFRSVATNETARSTPSMSDLTDLSDMTDVEKYTVLSGSPFIY